MTALGDDHYARIWSHKNIIDIRNYVPGTNLRVDLAANNLRPGRRLLDIGCGDGLLGALVKDRFEEVYGVDISERAVEIARQRGVIASRINLNIQGLPFNDNFFDSITCLATIQYIYDLHFICREFNRLLRSGGELILTAPNMRTYRRIYKLVFLGEFPRTSFDSEGYDGGTLVSVT
jgi:methionine biosynthesis protein MetW